MNKDIHCRFICTIDKLETELPQYKVFFSETREIKLYLLIWNPLQNTIILSGLRKCVWIYLY